MSPVVVGLWSFPLPFFRGGASHFKRRGGGRVGRRKKEIGGGGGGGGFKVLGEIQTRRNI